ncbi:MAG: CCA tRNA nucleotidyltransferase, partial [Methanobacterium sp.]|nr:CCA tRNA nucleotidyltransferase [Methanobacterium sp.]
MNNKDYQEILKEIKPGTDEINLIKKLASNLIKSINNTALEQGIDAQAVLVGSVAKGTWLSGKADVDIFIKFPLNTPEDTLKKDGVFLGRKCIEDMNGTFEFRYASHPYITGLIKGFEIDFVPCYDIKRTKKIKSAVDRTIPHTQYVKKHLKAEEADEVLLLKCFMKTIDTYGSEFKVGGFAGYLCELLVLHYKTFLRVLESASDDWKPGYSIDLAGYGTTENFKEPLIVVDPVDPDRNVAAALTLEKMSEFIAASRHFLKTKSISYFKPNPININLNKIKDLFKGRGTKTLIISFKAPDIPADALYPQINKTTNSTRKLVNKNGFILYDSASWTDEKEKIVILLEFEVWKLPRIRKHH